MSFLIKLYDGWRCRACGYGNERGRACGACGEPRW